jgi:hypothetical protein
MIPKARSFSIYFEDDCMKKHCVTVHVELLLKSQIGFVLGAGKT